MGCLAATHLHLSSILLARVKFSFFPKANESKTTHIPPHLASKSLRKEKINSLMNPVEGTRNLQGLSPRALADASREPPSGHLAALQLLTGILEFDQP